MASIILQKAEILPWLPGNEPRSLEEPLLTRDFLTFIVARYYKGKLEPDGINTLGRFISDLPALSRKAKISGNLQDGKAVMTRVLNNIKEMGIKEALNKMEISETAIERLEASYSLYEGQKVYDYDEKVILEDLRPIPKEGKKQTTHKILDDVKMGATGDRLKLWLGATFTPRETKIKVMNDEYRITKEQFLENVSDFSLQSLKDGVATFNLTYSETVEENMARLSEIGFEEENLKLDEEFKEIIETHSETMKIRVTDALSEAIENSDEEAITEEVKLFLLDKRVPPVYDLFDNLARISSSVLNPTIIIKECNIGFRLPTILEVSDEKRTHLSITGESQITISDRIIVPRVEIPSMKQGVKISLQKTAAQKERINLMQHIKASIKELENAIGELA